MERGVGGFGTTGPSEKERKVISTPFKTFNSYSRNSSPFSNAIPSSSFYTIPLFQMSVHSKFTLDCSL